MIFASTENVSVKLGERDVIRHIDTRINQGELMADIDKSMLTDKPSKLSDKRMP